jgi:tRNA U34 5-carboxymethylaminomethyl modifying GTPase MnmE/TrmE
MGMERARSAMASADIIAVVMDLQADPETLAAVLHRQGQSSGHASTSASESPVMPLVTKLMAQVTDLEGDARSSSAAAAALGDCEPASKREVSAEEAENALLRPQHQRTLLVLNKCDLQPAPQPATASAAASTVGSSQLQRSSNSDSSVNCCGPTGDHVSPSIQAGKGPVSRDWSGSPAGVQLPASLQAGQGQAEHVAEAVAISCKTGEGLDRLLARLSALVAEITDTGDAGEGGTIITR